MATEVASIRRLRARVVCSFPHDPAAFTQGLIWHSERGVVYESCGRYGKSGLREVDLRTGKVIRQTHLPSFLFAEGIAAVGDNIYQLTWREGSMRCYDRTTLNLLSTSTYEGEGWGLCYGEGRLIRSDGTDWLTFLDCVSLEPVRRVRVTHDGLPLHRLNDLAYADGSIFANIWESDYVVRIDPRSGRVTATIDASGLLTPEERAKTDVLNGIAYNMRTNTFLLTGKLWPMMFEVVFEWPIS